MTELNPAIESVELKHEKRKRWLKILTMVFSVIAVLYAIYWLGWGQFYDYTNDAYVTGNQVQLMPQVAGTVISINTDNTDLVDQGQLLIQLERTDNLIALQQAEANLAQTVRQVARYYENVAQAQAEVQLRQADLILAERNFQRRKGLVGVLAISHEEMQTYLTDEQAAQAQYDLAKHQLAAAVALVQNSHLYTHPLVEQAKAHFKAAYLAYVRTTIYSPVRGITAQRNVQVGQQVKPGSALLAVVPLNQMWVDANYKETQLKRIRVGQQASVTADANDYTYHGTVVGLNAGTGSAFSLLPAQNATGNWIKIVQRLPVRIALDPKELAKHPLQIGLSTEVTVYTRSTKGSPLPTIAQQKPVYVTPIYNNQLANADKIANQIIHTNAPYDLSLPAESHHG
ncbi:MAG: HlyD family efflux transporter periplasmic adaptor subunit [Gammaproteobacteria bacterium]